MTVGPQERHQAAQVLLRNGVLEALHVVKATRECGIATTHAELLGALGRRTTAALLQTGVLVGVPAGGGRLHYELTPDGDDLRERMSRALGEE